jgi:hypothetical protein
MTWNERHSDLRVPPVSSPRNPFGDASTIHLPGERRQAELASALAADEAAWRARLVVHDPQMHIVRNGERERQNYKPSLVDKQRDLLTGSPHRLILCKHTAPATIDATRSLNLHGHPEETLVGEDRRLAQMTAYVADSTVSMRYALWSLSGLALQLIRLGSP